MCCSASSCCTSPARCIITSSRATACCSGCCPPRRKPPPPRYAQHLPRTRARKIQRSRRARGHVGGERAHVVLAQLRDHRLHQRDRVSFAHAVLDVIELAEDIDGRTACEPRYA